MFNSIKNLAIASTIALSSVLTLGAEQAKAYQCNYMDGAQICYESDGYNSQGHQLWNLTMRNNYATEHLRVACDGYQLTYWKSRGDLSASDARYVARWFCAI